MHVVSHVGAHTLVQCESSRVCFLYFRDIFWFSRGNLGGKTAYNKRKTSHGCGTTVNTSWWFLDIPHSPFGLVWDVQGPPARIYGRPTSEARFPLLLYADARTFRGNCRYITFWYSCEYHMNLKAQCGIFWECAVS